MSSLSLLTTNRFPRWKSGLIGLVLALGFVYALPNLFGEALTVQVSPFERTRPLDAAVVRETDALLKKSQLPFERITLEKQGLVVWVSDTTVQLKIKEILQRAFEGRYLVALNLLPNTPRALQTMGARPMALGLDLRGGVHFLLELDDNAAFIKALDHHLRAITLDLQRQKFRVVSSKRLISELKVQFRSTEAAEKALKSLSFAYSGLQFSTSNAYPNTLVAVLAPVAIKQIREAAMTQNLLTLRNRVNELGVSEPLVQQQGARRIIVQLPGVQDIAKAKDILGRIATLEVRLVSDAEQRTVRSTAEKIEAPAGTEWMLERQRNGSVQYLLVEKMVALTGAHVTKAAPGFDQNNQPAVHLTFDATGASAFQQLTREHVGKRLAMILMERNHGEIITAPTIMREIGGGQVEISGAMTQEQAQETALLLRSGALAAPMEIVEERTIGPSLGRENIERGIAATQHGFFAVAMLMIVYYRVFGVISVVALTANLLLLIALLSIFQATLTLPGIAAIALTLGMAIDANVLINERIREELRQGKSAQLAIDEGYRHAWATILDANITTLIAGLALLMFGSGPVRGFAVVHCLGILTSLFSAVWVSRGLVNALYGGARKQRALLI